MNILITGSSGFVGSYLCEYLRQCQNIVFWLKLVKIHKKLCNNIKTITFDINDDLTSLDLSSVDVIVHCAGRAHIMKEVEK